MKPRSGGRGRSGSLREDGLIALLLRQHLCDVRGKRHHSELLKNIEQGALDVDRHYPAAIAEVLVNRHFEPRATFGKHDCSRRKFSSWTD
jgi:hypothetical protein